MPELAELKINADFINNFAKNRAFVRIRKNPTHKGPEIKSPQNNFQFFAQSRGKELKIQLDTGESIVFGLGMSGWFKESPSLELQKHSHLIFDSEDGTSLSFVDPRRFGNWKLGDWNSLRGPDPTFQFKEFCYNIWKSINHKDFKKPIYEVLMNQEYFNGIGNYLRAEILGRCDQNPFKSGKEFLENCPYLLELCRDFPIQCYNHLKNATINYNKDPYMKYYRLGQKVNDSSGRVFWFDKKWK